MHKDKAKFMKQSNKQEGKIKSKVDSVNSFLKWKHFW